MTVAPSSHSRFKRLNHWAWSFQRASCPFTGHSTWYMVVIQRHLGPDEITDKPLLSSCSLMYPFTQHLRMEATCAYTSYVEHHCSHGKLKLNNILKVSGAWIKKIPSSYDYKERTMLYFPSNSIIIFNLWQMKETVHYSRNTFLHYF